MRERRPAGCRLRKKVRTKLLLFDFTALSSAKRSTLAGNISHFTFLGSHTQKFPENKQQPGGRFLRRPLHCMQTDSETRL